MSDTNLQRYPAWSLKSRSDAQHTWNDRLNIFKKPMLAFHRFVRIKVSIWFSAQAPCFDQIRARVFLRRYEHLIWGALICFFDAGAAMNRARTLTLACGQNGEALPGSAGQFTRLGDNQSLHSRIINLLKSWEAKAACLSVPCLGLTNDILTCHSRVNRLLLNSLLLQASFNLC